MSSVDEKSEINDSALDVGRCARCKQEFSDSALRSLPRPLASVFAVIFAVGGADDDETGSEVRYCADCRSRLCFVMGLFVVLFGGILLLVGLVKLVEFVR